MGDCVFGVSIGSFSAGVCAYKDGRMEVLANELGHRSTPSVVTFLEGEKLVGVAAKQSFHRFPRSTSTHMIHMLGQHSIEAVAEIVKDLPCAVKIENDTVTYSINVDGKDRTIPVQDPLIEVLKKLKDTAHSFHQESHMYSVVASPANFTGEQQALLKECSVSAGFNILRCISEPAAACLAYGIGQHDVTYSGFALVYNLGGSSLSLSLLHVTGGLYRTVLSRTLLSLGGQMLNGPLVDLMAEEFQRRWKEDVRKHQRALWKLRAAAEAAKHTLSVDQTASVHVDSLHDGIDLQHTLTRGRFEGVCTPLFRRMIEPVNPLLLEAGVDKNNLDHVVLAGGSCKIPRLQQMLRDEFPCSTLHYSISPDEVISRGCALQAGLMAAVMGRKKEEGAGGPMPCTPLNLWLTCPDCPSSEAVLLLPKHTPIPCEQSASLTLKLEEITQQERLCVQICEGMSPAARTIVKLLPPVIKAPQMTIEVSVYWKRDNKVTVVAQRTPCTESEWSCSLVLDCDAKTC